MSRRIWTLVPGLALVALFFGSASAQSTNPESGAAEAPVVVVGVHTSAHSTQPESASATTPPLSPSFARWVKQYEKRQRTAARSFVSTPPPAPPEQRVIPPNKVQIFSRVNEGRAGAERQQLEQIAARLSDPRLIPAERLQFFSAISQMPDWVIGGWEGTVREVNALPDGGHRVSVNFVPVLANPPYTVHSSYTEVFEVKGQDVRFVQSLDPENQAGQMPSLCTY